MPYTIILPLQGPRRDVPEAGDAIIAGSQDLAGVRRKPDHPDGQSGLVDKAAKLGEALEIVREESIWSTMLSFLGFLSLLRPRQHSSSS